MADYFGRQTWFSLPLHIRVQWWQDTDYGRQPPSLTMCETRGARGALFGLPRAPQFRLSFSKA